MAFKSLTKFIVTRVTPDDHKQFHRRASKYGNPSDVLREIVKAFNDDRLIVKQPTQPTKGIYNVD